MAIQTTQTAFSAGSYPIRAAEEGWVPRFEEPEPVQVPSLRSLAAVANPVVNSLAELVQPALSQTPGPDSIDTNDDELRGVFAEMAADRQNRVAARASLAQAVQADWTRAQEEVRSNEQMRQANMSNMWRSTFNPYGGGGMMPMPMTPMAPMGPMGPAPQLGMQVSMPNTMQPGMPGAFPPGPGIPMTGTFSTFPTAPGVVPGAPYPAQPGVPTTSGAMAGAPSYYYR